MKQRVSRLGGMRSNILMKTNATYQKYDTTGGKHTTALRTYNLKNKKGSITTLNTHNYKEYKVHDSESMVARPKKSAPQNLALQSSVF
jgi:hypothetical protein